MIRTIRKNFNLGFINKIFVLVFVLALMGIFSLPMIFKKGSGMPWSLRVNGQEVASDIFEQEVNLQRERINQFRAQYGQYADMLFKSMGINLDPRSLTIDFLTKQLLLQALSESMGMVVSPDFVLEKIQSIDFVKKYLSDVVPPFIFDEQGAVNQRILRAYLQQRGLSIDALLELATNAIKRQVVASCIAQAVYIPEFDLKASYSAKNAAKKYSIVTFAYDTFLKDAQAEPLVEEALQAFFQQQNKEFQRYFIPEQRNGIVWHVQPNHYNIHIDNDAIENFYLNNRDKKYIASPAKVHIRKIVYYTNSQDNERPSLIQLRDQLLADPSLFSEFAKKYSDDKETAHKGGLTDPFARNDSDDKEFEKAAFTLKEEGSISDVVPVKDGLALVQLVKKSPRSYIPLSDVKDKIKQQLMEEEFKKQFTIDMKTIMKQDDDKQAALESFLKHHSAHKEVLSKKEMDDNSRSTQLLFKLSKPDTFDFYINDGQGYIVMLTNIIKKNLPSLDSIKKRVEEDFYHDKADHLLQDALQKARNELNTNSIESIAQKYGARLESTGWVSPDNNNDLKMLEKKDIPFRELFQLENEGSVYIQRSPKKGLLIYLDEIAPIKESVWQAEKKDIFMQKKQENTRLLVESVIASLYRDATIEINESFKTPSEDYSI